MIIEVLRRIYSLKLASKKSSLFPKGLFNFKNNGTDGNFKFQERRPNEFIFLDLGLEGQNLYDKNSTFTEDQIKIIKGRTMDITRDLNSRETRG